LHPHDAAHHTSYGLVAHMDMHSTRGGCA
jgi:hypothetical protein